MTSPRRTSRVDFNIEALIQEVHYRPAIWDKKCDSYTDRLLKARMWEEVCANVVDNWSKLNGLERKHISGELQKKWRNVKDAFKKELAFKNKIAMGLKPVKKKRQYIHFKALSFLASDADIPGTTYMEESDDESDNLSIEQENTNYESNKTTEENLLDVKQEKYTSDDENSSCALSKLKDNNEDLNFIEIEPVQCTYDDEYGNYRTKKQAKSVPEEDESSSGTKRTKRTYEERITNNYHNKKNRRRTQDDEHFVETRRVHKGFDEDISFAEMLIPMLRKLNDDQKHFAKIEILNVLHKAKGYNPPSSSNSQNCETQNEGTIS